MSITLLTTIDEAQDLVPAWEQLPAGGASSVYTSPAWCMAAWRNFPDLGAPYVAAAMARDGALVGVLPLTIDGDRLSWAGAPLGDEHDARVRPDGPAAKLASALVHAATRRLSAKSASLADVRPNGVLTSVSQSSPGCPAPILPLHDPDPEFGALACIPGWSHDRRRGLRSARRRLAERGKVTVDRLTDPRSLAAALPTFVAQRLSAFQDRKRWHELPAMDRHPCFAQFLAEVGAGLGLQGRCLLSRIKLDGEPIAQSLIFRAPGADLLYMSTYRPEWARYSPSHLLLAEAAHTAVGEGIRVIELGRGDEPYKFDLGALPRRLSDLTLTA